MSRRLTDLLGDLAADTGPSPATHDLAARAWTTGRRRRWRHRAVTAVVAAVVLLLGTVTVLPVVGVTGLMEPSSGGDEGEVSGYPQRIGHQWTISDLPQEAGMVAGELHVSSGDADEWLAFAESGELFQGLPEGVSGWTPETVSPDGSPPGWRTSAEDVLTVGRGLLVAVGVRHLQELDDAPVQWSADGRALVSVTPAAGADVAAVVLAAGSAVEPVAKAGDLLAGWATADTLAWVDWSQDDDGDVRATVRVRRLDGTLVRAVPLNVDGLELHPWHWSPWTFSVSPSGGALTMVDVSAVEDVPQLLRFTLGDGARQGEPVALPGLAEDCPMSWAGDTPVVSRLLGDDDALVAQRIDVDGPETIAVTEPGLHGQCLVWASSALEAGPHDALWGLSTGWWTWWWRELVGVLAVLGVFAWIWKRLRRRDESELARLGLLGAWKE